jgi:hypothetical protein
MMSFAQVAKRGVVGGLRQQVLAKRGGFGFFSCPWLSCGGHVQTGELSLAPA